MSRLNKFISTKKRGCVLFEKHKDHCAGCYWLNQNTKTETCSAPLLLFRRRSTTAEWFHKLCQDLPKSDP